MARNGYIIRDQQAIYYMTFTIVGWIDIFSRQIYRDMFIDSLKYCQQNKGLHLHAYVIMTNHVHLIVSVDEGLSESRRDWMLHQFKYYASRHSRNEHYQLWEQDNHFIELSSPAFTQQKIEYIHNNPVKAGWVTRPKIIFIQARQTMRISIKLLMWIVCFFDCSLKTTSIVVRS